MCILASNINDVFKIHNCFLATVTSGGFANYANTFTVNQANTWELKHVYYEDISVPGYLAIINNTTSLVSGWALGLGENLTGPLQTWQINIDVKGVSGGAQVINNAGSFKLADTMLIPYVPGSPRPLFNNFVYAGGDYRTEFRFCLRYFEINAHSNEAALAAGVMGSLGAVNFREHKRDIPVVTIFGNGVPDAVRDNNNGATVNGPFLIGVGTNNFSVRRAGGLSDNINYGFSSQADAEL